AIDRAEGRPEQHQARSDGRDDSGHDDQGPGPDSDPDPGPDDPDQCRCHPASQGCPHHDWLKRNLPGVIAMADWDRGDAEMAIALKRAELNRALSYKTKYNAEGHNICLALVRFTDGTIDVLAAYSNDSAIPESIRLGLNLIANVYAVLPVSQRFGCDGMAQ